MKTKEQIEKELARIKSDPRLSYPPAKISSDAPLALIQTGLDAWVSALEWTLGFFDEAEQCLHTDLPSALPSVVESNKTAGG